MSYREIDVAAVAVQTSYGVTVIVVVMFTVTIARYRKKVRKVNFQFLISEDSISSLVNSTSN